MISHHRLPVSVGFIQSAVIVLGGLIVLFLWMVFHYHSQQVYDERLEGEAAGHLNIAVIIAENLRQMADRAKAAGGIYSSELGQDGEQLANRLSPILAGDPVFNRLSVFDAEGRLLFASHKSALAALPPTWLERMQNAPGSTGSEPQSSAWAISGLASAVSRAYAG